MTDQGTHLGGGDNAVGVHDPVRVLLSDLGDEQRTHAGPSAAAQGVGQLEALETVAALGLFPDHVQHTVDKLGPFSVVSLGPIVSRPRLSKHKVVRSEDLTKGSGADRVHRSWLQINKDCSRNVFATTCLVVIDIDPLQLEVGVAVVGAGGVDAMLVRDDLPELKVCLISKFLYLFYLKHALCPKIWIRIGVKRTPN